METKIDEVIHQKTAMGSYKFPDPYADEVLTPEEVETALRKARHEKAVARKSREYYETLSKPKEYPKLTLDDFKSAVLAKIRIKIPEYIIDKYNEKQFHLLALYFLGDPELEKIDGGIYSLKKGWLIVGNIGCGKTSMIMGFNVNPTKSFGFVSCRTVASEYAQKEIGGSTTIKRYSSVLEVAPYDNWGQKYVGRIFDDLGTENVKKHFGNESNVMEEVILNLYDNPDLAGCCHFTSNLSADQIEESYGPRVRSRLREMCNLLLFDPNGADRRK